MQRWWFWVQLVAMFVLLVVLLMLCALRVFVGLDGAVVDVVFYVGLALFGGLVCLLFVGLFVGLDYVLPGWVCLLVVVLVGCAELCD